MDAQEITVDRLLLEANLLEQSPTNQRAVYALATVLALTILSGYDLTELIAIKREYNGIRFPEHRFQTGTYPAAYAACKAEEREKQLKNTHLYPMLEAVLARREVVRM